MVKMRSSDKAANIPSLTILFTFVFIETPQKLFPDTTQGIQRDI